MDGPLRAMTVPLAVVSCVTPEGIIRALAHWVPAKEMIRQVLHAVGTLATETEWSGYVYEGMPYYIEHGGYVTANGIYLFRWRTPDQWRDATHRRSESRGELLWRPRGWCSGPDRTKP